MYLAFLLDLAGDGENRTVPKSVRYEPDKSLRAANAFHWKIVCDINSKVVVRGFHDGKFQVVASAKWHEGKLVNHRQRGTVPTDYQWKLVELALFAERAKADTALLPADDHSWSDNADIDELTPSTVVDVPLTQVGHAKRRIVADIVPREKRKLAIVIGVASALVAIFAIVMVSTKSSRRAARQPPAPNPVAVSTATAATPEPPVAPSPPPPPPQSVETQIANAGDLASAVALAKPAMTDDAEELPEGARQLARYATAKLRWAEVGEASSTVPTTTIGLVLKDPDVERGKRLCASGIVRRIERRDVAGRKVYVGHFETKEGDGVAFVAVGSTGEIVQRSEAAFCGIVTGKSAQSVAVLGMFDLPENRAPLVEAVR